MREPGTELKKFVYKNLGNIFTKDLAARFTYEGRQGNLAIKDLKTLKVMKCTSNNHFIFLIHYKSILIFFSLCIGKISIINGG